MKKDGLRWSLDAARKDIEGLSYEAAVAKRGKPFVDAVLGGKPGAASVAPGTKRGPFNAHPRARKWPTPEGQVVTFPSKTEAAVFDRLSSEVATLNRNVKPDEAPAAVLFRQVRLVLDTIAPNARGVPYTLTIDFMIRFRDGTRRYVEAKSKKKNREWMRGAAAARAAGYEFEEVDR